MPASVRRRLALCFADLRDLHAKGLLSYPYSIREAVALARHIEAYPQDGVLAALENVLGFDAYSSPDLRATIADVFRRRGVPLRAGLRFAQGEEDEAGGGRMVRRTVSLAESTALPQAVPVGSWRIASGAAEGKVLVRREGQLRERGWGLQGAPTPARYAVEPSRLDVFTEEASVDKRGRGTSG